MHSTILSGAAIPIGDRALVAAVNAVSCGPGADPARLRIAVVNEQGAVYREIFSRDFTEHAQLLRCLAGHGFAVQSGVHGVHIDWLTMAPVSSTWPLQDWHTLIAATRRGSETYEGA